jgi:hypothetical protein
MKVKRYVLCGIKGDGSYSNPYRPAIADVTGNFVAAWETDQDGKPVGARVFCRVAREDFAPVLAVAGTYALPDYPLDAKISAMQLTTRLALRAALVARGFPGGDFDLADGYRDVIRAIGRRLRADFNEDSFDVSE